MDAEKAKALRAPFPPAVIGKLPKPYKAESAKGQCRECGGWHGLPAVHLDYVGHAATTDRLLQVDPAWTWEPFATDAAGLPMLDSRGNLWIRLTVAGVTRIGVGDGKSLKECIGDAIRNAAMRFGVALDLWAKEDLHAADVERGTVREPEPEPEPPAPVVARPTRAMARPTPKPTMAELKDLAIAISAAGVPDAERLPWLTDLCGRQITSSKDLTRAEWETALTVAGQIGGAA